MAVVLGVRCWRDRLALVALSSDPAGSPHLMLHRRVKLPGGDGSDADRIRWVHKTVVEAIEEAGAEAVAVRVSDADPEQLRTEHEGVALFAGANRGLPVATLRRQSMLKPLGVGREAGAWKAFPKRDSFVSGFVGDEQEAAMVARAMLNRGLAS